ncbi:MAG: PHB depolymerase family esterase [Candidatus Caenarcaniphilales bacterium]|nr:PHB depolymerase family esterase [Candidatus Caenarcaniphilales bacterium]
MAIFLLSPLSSIGYGNANITEFLTVNGRQRSYIVHVPAICQSGKYVPLVFVLHGGGGKAQQIQRYTGFDQIADKGGFIVVYPNAIDGSWQDSSTRVKKYTGEDDVPFFQEMIRSLSSKYRIDKNRIYATGISNGGFMSQQLACRLSGQIAAVASVASTIGLQTFQNCYPSRPVGNLFIFGDADPLVSIDGKPRVNALSPGNNSGDIVSLNQAFQKWINLDGCIGQPASIPNINQSNYDDTSVSSTIYKNCRGAKSVSKILIHNGGHTWPQGSVQYLPERLVGKTSQDFNASQVIWEFFQNN